MSKTRKLIAEVKRIKLAQEWWDEFEAFYRKKLAEELITMEEAFMAAADHTDLIINKAIIDKPQEKDLIEQSAKKLQLYIVGAMIDGTAGPIS
ncbi:MAG TPA: hypothetical protein ENH31_00470 [Nitrospirae bacterium]|nr:hypothetical protein [Nitrospirota bacterium]HDK81026.1 hypothetical protein [Nitrospirota bacterium]